jgi:hypothetical protein
MDNELAPPPVKNTIVTTSGNKEDAFQAVQKIMKYIEDGVQYFNIAWNVEKDVGIMHIIKESGEQLQLNIPNRQSLFNLNMAMARYYITGQFNPKTSAQIGMDGKPVKPKPITHNVSSKDIFKFNDVNTSDSGSESKQ